MRRSLVLLFASTVLAGCSARKQQPVVQHTAVETEVETVRNVRPYPSPALVHVRTARPSTKWNPRAGGR